MGPWLPHTSGSTRYRLGGGRSGLSSRGGARHVLRVGKAWGWCQTDQRPGAEAPCPCVLWPYPVLLCCVAQHDALTRERQSTESLVGELASKTKELKVGWVLAVHNRSSCQ